MGRIDQAAHQPSASPDPDAVDEDPMATMESVKVVVARREEAVLYRSEAEIMTSPRSALFTPISRHAHRRLQCLLSAKSGHRARWGLRPTLSYLQ